MASSEGIGTTSSCKRRGKVRRGAGEKSSALFTSLGEADHRRSLARSASSGRRPGYTATLPGERIAFYSNPWTASPRRTESAGAPRPRTSESSAARRPRELGGSGWVDATALLIVLDPRDAHDRYSPRQPSARPSGLQRVPKSFGGSVRILLLRPPAAKYARPIASRTDIGQFHGPSLPLAAWRLTPQFSRPGSPVSDQSKRSMRCNGARPQRGVEHLTCWRLDWTKRLPTF
jgi:hypothetical protein